MKLLKQTFPDAQNFGATRNYWARAEQEHKKSSERRQLEQGNRRQQKTSETVRKLERQKKLELRRRWAELSEAGQQRIDGLAYEAANDFVRRKMDAGQFDDHLVELARLQALERDDTDRAA